MGLGLPPPPTHGAWALPSLAPPICARPFVLQGASNVGLAWRSLDLSILLRLSPALLPRAGGVVKRMLEANYLKPDINTAVDALYVNRDARHIARLWGLFDKSRSGEISSEVFDDAILLLTEGVSAADLPDARTALGFIHADKVAPREFELALKKLIPADGSAASLPKGTAVDIDLPALLGGTANVQRLQPFQRHRLTRVARRMKNFGYPAEAITQLTKTLFLTKLHNKDLWKVWQLLQPHDTEASLTAAQVYHLLTMLSEPRDVEQVALLIDKVDENQSGDIQFEELATLLRAVSPQLPRPSDVESIRLESHPLIDQMHAIYESAKIDLMSSAPWQLRANAERSALLAMAVRRLDVPTRQLSTNVVEFRRTLNMLGDVSRELLFAASEGERRGSLADFCEDAQAHAFAQMAQALTHAAAMLEHEVHDSYEVHVALRTIKTVELIERRDESKRVSWRMPSDQGPHGEEGVSSRTSKSSRGPRTPESLKASKRDSVRAERAATTAAALARIRRSSTGDGDGDAAAAAAAAAAAGESDAGSPSPDASLRGAGLGALFDEAGSSPSPERRSSPSPAAERWPVPARAPGEEPPEAGEAGEGSSAAFEAMRRRRQSRPGSILMGINAALNEAADDGPQSRKPQKKETEHARRRRIIKGGSAADALMVEMGNDFEVRALAMAYQRERRAANPEAMRRAIVLGGVV